MLTLLRADNPLADPAAQRAILNQPGLARFDDLVRLSDPDGLRACGLEVLQVNLGKLCNQTCRHCHVDAGPDRREAMSAETADHCLEFLAAAEVPTLDITGGAPEMCAQFRRLVQGARRLDRSVIDRCNLTILLAPGYRDLPEFLAEQQVQIVASLPCYTPENTDQQRGDGVFDRSIEALRRLNDLGYGQPESLLTLTLVYNPLGPRLPPLQSALEAAYRRELYDRYRIVFNRLYTITNLPISRFLDDLLQTAQYENYLQTLIDAYNPAAAREVMCRTMLSVGWDGRLFDCDFNQMLDLGLSPGLPQTIGALLDRLCAAKEDCLSILRRRAITTGRHCFGCTAGAGSSCAGATINEEAEIKRPQ